MASVRLLRGLLATGVLLAASAPLATAQGLDFQVYRTRVEPIFFKARPANGPGGTCFMCHSYVNTRFRLAPVGPGGASWTEAESRRNFEAVSRLVTPGDPLKSRLLLHPLALQAGGDPIHSGGKHWETQNDPDWQTIAAWVRAASPSAASSPAPAAATLDFETYRTRVEPVFLNKRAGLARCYVCHSRATNFRLQPLTPGSTTWNEAQSRQNFLAVQRLVLPGDPLLSRLLMMPLAHDAGGDPFHPGGKHWKSAEDPEWQTMAAWVKGQAK